MRKRQKQDILEILQSLYEANREIEAALKNKQPELARNMLCDCQECAIELGNVIDQAEGEGTEAVSYLEKYCEVLFHYHQKLSEMEQLDKKAVEKIKKALDKQIREIENSIQNNIPERQEIVFMPYKASMWDSLESVYLAAKEDPDCDAYCVPIPYFDKNPDGSLGQMHYEIDQYPKNIEVVNRLNYKLEERRPDVIYIHNPYDECNHVTCVHPDYFSSRLKQYTDKLVYIPYFVLQEIEPDDEKSIEQMRHFCFLPGTINADRVIVQSEKMRQIYINEYLKAAKVYGLTGEHLDRAKLEEKFLGLGSPKFDKVVNTRKEDLDIPSEWLKVIEKEDGSWKKIILYNTSINALLKHEEQMLIKMKSVFELFKEHQKEVALLWRPHPLIPSTIQSMRPQLWEKYKEIVEQYKEEGWGIYDDSSDLDRAVVLSDGYYGDPSSVVEVYLNLSKSVMIQNCLIRNKDTNRYPLLVQDLTVVDGYAYASLFENNMLVKVHLNTGNSEYLGYFSEENKEWWLYINGIYINGQIVWIPYNADKIAIYNMEKNFTIYFNIPDIEKKYVNNLKFGVSFLFENCIYAFGYGIPIILVMDVTTWEIKTINFSNKIPENEIPMFFKFNYCIVDDYVYLPIISKNIVMEFSLITHSYVFYQVENTKGNFSEGFTEIIYEKKQFRLFNWNDEEIIWTKGKNNIKYYKNNYLDAKLKAYKKVIAGKNEIRIPYFSPQVILKKENGEISIINALQTKIDEDNNSSFLLTKEISNFLYMETNRKFEWSRIDLNSLKVEKVFFDIDAEEIKKHFNNIKEKKFWENNLLSLKNYLEWQILLV